jgi:acetyl/propionyl-CoA carboxylase alpha subunit
LFAQAAAEIGYPVLIKAAGGGGGRGMRVVRTAEELAAALASAQAEAANAFGDSAVFLEKFIERGRHIEFQVFGDTHGHIVHLFERECSVQRRHQKIIEESPSPLLAQHPDLREAMGRAAVAAARAVNYTNAGTIEFIVDPDTLAFYFLEMNTRLQVEHPVTETLTGLDLVHLQLRVAQGEPLPFTQDQITARGHALECRLYAEDPANGYLPSIGPLLKTVEPHGPGVRVDTGFVTGDQVTQYYDAMLAKIIAAAPDRAAAIERMSRALRHYVVLGLTTNLPFLQAILAHPEFRAGNTTTKFLVDHFDGWRPIERLPPPAALAALGLFDTVSTAAPTPPHALEASPVAPTPWLARDGFRLSS